MAQKKSPTFVGDFFIVKSGVNAVFIRVSAVFSFPDCSGIFLCFTSCFGERFGEKP